MNILKIGFTGTERGMTPFQRDWLFSVLDAYSFEPGERWFLMGDCIGADIEAAEIAKNLGFMIWVFPPNNPSRRARYAFPDYMEPEYPHLVRNHHIVEKCDLLLAAPAENYEVLRSGVWSTVRYAKKLDKYVSLCYPQNT